jgi:aconitate hydratase
VTDINLSGKTYRYYDFNKLNDPRIAKLPISIKVLLECAVRNCDNYNVTEKDVENIINWKETSKASVLYP